MITVPLSTLPPERRGHTPSRDLALRRETLARAVAAGKWRTSRAPLESTIGGVRALRFRPDSAAKAVIVHFHGGGFRIGCPEMIGPFAAALSAECDVEVICPDYRLAPEHPMPAALRDGVDVLNTLLRSGARKLILAGDSAGGGLATSIAALCATAGVVLSGLILLSPWLDLTVTDRCYEANAATDALFSREAALEAANLYLQGIAASEPLASPLFARVTDFPPTFISVGKGEVLAGDAQRLHSMLQAVGVDSHVLMLADMEHVAITRSFELPGATQTFEAIATFIDGLLNH